MFAYNLEVGIYPSDFIFYSILDPFLNADEELGLSREVLDLFKNKIVTLTCVVFQVQDKGAYLLGIDDPPDIIYLCIVPFFWGFVLCVELKIGVYRVSAS